MFYRSASDYIKWRDYTAEMVDFVWGVVYWSPYE